MTSSDHPQLRLRGITKRFPGVVALRDVSFDVNGGEVHALVGENGAGKSTLMSVAAGSLSPDEGSVEIDGHRLARSSPAEAQALGLAVVYQHATALEDLSVAENLAFAMPKHLRPRLGQAVTWARTRLQTVQSDIDPSLRFSALSVAQRQLVEIAKALALEARVVVFDEPTESLTAAESERLFEQIRRLRAAGAAVVYISHRLPEVQQITDRLTVLRDGETRGTFDTAAVTRDEIIALIVGRSVQYAFPPKRSSTNGDAPLLAVAGVSGGRLNDVNFEVSSGEIVGLAGVEGNGQRELIRALGGLYPHHGSVRVGGAEVGGGDPARAVDAGLVYLPRDRHREGLFLPLSIRENASLLALHRFATAGVVNRRREVAEVSAVTTALAVKAPSIGTPVASLSGGNQQKTAIARALLARPTVLLADDPTRGVDVGARQEIYRQLRDFAETGKAVLVASADAIELQGLCDRVLVFSRGGVAAELSGDGVTEEAMTSAAVNAERRSGGAAPSRVNRVALRRALEGDYAPSLIVGVVIVVLALYTWQRSSHFLGSRSVVSILFLTAILLLGGLGQATVLLAGSIDLSVGPLMGFTVVMVSITDPQGGGAPRLVLMVVVLLAVGIGVGLTNALLIRLLRLPAVMATLVTYIVLLGVALILRPQPKGIISDGLTSGLQRKVGALPLAFLVVLVVVLAAEIGLRRSRVGLELRAVGSDEERARRLGARSNATFYVAHVICSICAVGGGLLLAAEVGIGQAGTGTDYTLSTIAAVVLGGASLLGGRGSYVGALLGALLIQEATAGTSFLGLGQAWQEWLPGLLILLAAGAYSRARQARAGAGAAA